MTSRTGTHITAFEVPSGADEAFLAAWERAPRNAVLHRALRSDVDFRFVAVGPEPAVQIPFESHPALYEIVYEEGQVDQSGGTVLINPFEVPAGQDSPFVEQWERVHQVFAEHHGYLGTRLYRSVDESADFRFVNVARWSSPLMSAGPPRARRSGRRRGRLPIRAIPPSMRSYRRPPNRGRDNLLNLATAV